MRCFFLLPHLAAQFLEYELKWPKVTFLPELLKYEDYVRRKQKQRRVDKLGENQGVEELFFVALGQSVQWKLFNALIGSRENFLIGSEIPQIREHCKWY